MRNLSLAQMDRDSLFHPVTSIAENTANGPTIYASGKGVWLRGQDEREYLDMGAGLWCVNLGYGREDLADVAREAMQTLSFQHLFGSAASEPAIRLANQLVSVFRRETGAEHIARAFFGSSGSDANDTAYKLVKYYHNITGRPAKKKIIARMGAYHGLTYAATGLTGIPGYHTAFDAPQGDVIHISCPHYYRNALPGETEAQFGQRLVGELEAVIAREGADTIGGFIAEPIMGTGGVVLPPEGYFEGVQALLAKHDILFIVDEVITGFGRLGSWFASGSLNLKPDIVSLAKGLTSAYLPLSANLIGERVWDALESRSAETGAFMHGYTYSGHPVCCAVGLATIAAMETENVVEPVSGLGDYLLDCLRDAVGDNRFVGHIRGHGLMAAVEFVANRETRAEFGGGVAPHKLVSAAAKREGLLARALPYLPVTAFSPPLIVTREEIDEAVRRFAIALDTSMPELEAAAAAG